MASLSIEPITPADRDWVRQFLIEHWGADVVVSRGVVHRPAELPGYIAALDGERVGLLTYHIADGACEVTSLDSTRPAQGVGTALMEAAIGAARAAGCRRLWLITTNDNLNALRFYQKRGLALVAVYPNALALSRQLKPEIPLVGHDGIPLRDEIELELVLDARQP